MKKSTTSPKTASRISAAKDGLSTKASLLKDKAVVSMPTNSLNTSGDDGDDIPLTKSESKSKVTNIGHGNQGKSCLALTTSVPAKLMVLFV